MTTWTLWLGKMGANVFPRHFLDATLEMVLWESSRHWDFDSQLCLREITPKQGGCGKLQSSVTCSRTRVEGDAWCRLSLFWGLERRSESWQGWLSLTKQIGSTGARQQILSLTVLSKVRPEFVSWVSMTQEKNTEDRWLKWNIAIDKDNWKDDRIVSNKTSSSFGMHTDAVLSYLWEQV